MILIEFQVLLIDSNQVKTNNTKLTCHDTNTDVAEYDHKETEYKDTKTQDNVQDTRHDSKVSHASWSTQTNQVDKQYFKDYDNMCRKIIDAHRWILYSTETDT